MKVLLIGVGGVVKRWRRLLTDVIPKENGWNI